MGARQFFRSVYADNARRTGESKRALGPDLLRYAKNSLFRATEQRLVEAFRANELPVAFIVGIPRSGTTLLFQLMCRFLDIGYPSAFVAGYWMAPIWASQKQRRDAGIDRSEILLESVRGRTRGSDAPHEFSWFWHHWIPGLEYCDDLSPAERDRIDREGLVGELQGLAGMHRSAFVWKSLNFCSFQIDWLNRVLPAPRFIWLERSPIFTAQSIYLARQHAYGDPGVWWSSRPRDYRDWSAESPEKQIVHQMRDIERAVRVGLDSVAESNRWCLTYERLIANPHEEIGALARFLDTEVVDGVTLDSLELSERNEKRLPDSVFAALHSELEMS